MADSPALITLVGNNSRLINYSNAKAYTYTNLMAVGFHLPLSLFGFLSIHIPIYYLFTIILTDYSNNFINFLLYQYVAIGSMDIEIDNNDNFEQLSDKKQGKHK